ncbi:hypothetical protein [Oricola sp.]|uniref:hypothetical protein n=1 Tax=Oricola sp. TaxID=1979950 RepID=UPI003BAD5DF0
MSGPVSTADLEQALAACAYIVLQHGDAYVPLVDRLEDELAERRKCESARVRAARILNSMSVEVTHALAG